MKDKVKTISKYYSGYKGIILSLYITAVLSTHYIVSGNLRKIIISTVITLILSLIVCPPVLNCLSKVNIEKRLKRNNGKKISPLFCFLPFVILTVQYIAYYPGGFLGDTFTQLTQAKTNVYDDWHPVLHTLLFIKLPLLISGGRIPFIPFFQIIIFSLVIAYTLFVLNKHVNSRAAAIVLIYISINPQTVSLVLFPLKDLAFAIGALLLMDFALEIYFSDGQWMKQIPNIIVFIIIITFTTIFRHNAILFTLPYLIAVSLIISKKRTIIILVSVIVLFVGIKVPFYQAINVQPPAHRQAETLGLPMSVIGAVTAKTPEVLDDETKEFVYSVSPKEVWEECYDYTGYNSVKYQEETDNTVLDNYSIIDVSRMMVKCIEKSPAVAFKELVLLTNNTYSVLNDSIYNLEGDRIFFNFPHVVDNVFNITTKGMPQLQKINSVYTIGCATILYHVFFSVGTLHLILLIILLIKCKGFNKNSIKKILITLPVIAYNFGTMLLLTASTDSLRFYYYTFIIFPILFIILIKEPDKPAENIIK